MHLLGKALGGPMLRPRARLSFLSATQQRQTAAVSLWAADVTRHPSCHFSLQRPKLKTTCNSSRDPLDNIGDFSPKRQTPAAASAGKLSALSQMAIVQF